MFTVRNEGKVTPADTGGGARGDQRGGLSITSNGCGTTLQPGASCDIAVAFAPKTRSGSRSARLDVGAPSGGREVSLSGTALPSLGLLAGGLGGLARRRDGRDRAFHFRTASPATEPATSTSSTATAPSGRSSSRPGRSPRSRAWRASTAPMTGRARPPASTIRTASPATGPATSTSPTRPHHPEGRHRDRRRHHARGRGRPERQRRRNGRGRPFRRAGRHRRRRGGQPLRRRQRQQHHPEGRHRDRGRHHVRGRGGRTAQRRRDGRGRPFQRAERHRQPTGRAISTSPSNHTIRKVVIATGAVTTLAGAAAGAAPQTGRARPPASTGRPASPATARATSTSPIPTTHHPEGRHRDRRRHHLRGRGGPVRQRGRNGRGRPFQPPVRHRHRRGGQPLRRRHREQHHPQGRPRDRGRHHARGRGEPIRQRRRDGRCRSLQRPAGIASDGAGNLYVAEPATAASGRSSSRPGPSPRSRARASRAARTDGRRRPFTRTASPATGRATSTSPTAATAPSGRSSSRPGRHHDRGRQRRDRRRRRNRRGRAFQRPYGIASDGAGNLYVADTATAPSGRSSSRPGLSPRSRARRSREATTGRTAARFNRPLGIASDGAGNLYVADTDNSTIRKVVIATGAVTTLAGTAGQSGSADGTGAAARFNDPRGIASDGAGNLYVVDSNTIRKIAIASATVSTVIGSPGRSRGVAGRAAGVAQPALGVAVLPTGELAIVDSARTPS